MKIDDNLLKGTYIWSLLQVVMNFLWVYDRQMRIKDNICNRSSVSSHTIINVLLFVALISLLFSSAVVFGAPIPSTSIISSSCSLLCFFFTFLYRFVMRVWWHEISNSSNKPFNVATIIGTLFLFPFQIQHWSLTGSFLF